eukprot:13894810-Ditylum_brightwellii.AAC.1
MVLSSNKVNKAIPIDVGKYGMLWIKNIGWTSPDMQTTKVIIITTLDAKPLLNWGPSIRTQNVIQNMGHIIKSKGPKGEIILSWPMES